MLDLKKLVDMMKNASEMQKNISEELKKHLVTGEAGGGMVKAQMNGHFELLDLSIDDSVMQQEDKAFLCDLMKAAINDATRQLRESMADKIKSMTSGLGF